MADLKSRLIEEAKEVDVVEVWLDSIQDLRLAEIFFEKENIQTPFLFVNKIPEEGGDFMGTSEEHVDRLVEMLERGARYVDVAFQTENSLIDRLVKAKGENDQLIISYHNFEETPDFKNLQKLVEEAVSKGADIVKIATFVGDRAENTTLIEITRWAKEKGINIITVGMGEEGVLSRVICPLLGSNMYYAPLNKGDETAPGQLTKSELQEIWRSMGY